MFISLIKSQQTGSLNLAWLKQPLFEQKKPIEVQPQGAMLLLLGSV
jgi:hypothetical protein